MDDTIVDGFDAHRAVMIGIALLVLELPLFEIVFLAIAVACIKEWWEPVVWERKSKTIRVS